MTRVDRFQGGENLVFGFPDFCFPECEPVAGDKTGFLEPRKHSASGAQVGAGQGGELLPRMPCGVWAGSYFLCVSVRA